MKCLLSFIAVAGILAGSTANASSCFGVGGTKGERAEVVMAGGKIRILFETAATGGGLIRHVCMGIFRSSTSSPNYVMDRQNSLNCADAVGVDLARARNNGLFVNVIFSTFEGQVQDSYLCRQ